MALCLGLSICHCHKRSSIETDERIELGFLFSVFEFEYLFKKHATNVHATELKAVSRPIAMVQKVK